MGDTSVTSHPPQGSVSCVMSELEGRLPRLQPLDGLARAEEAAGM
jgi:hypothetical protein